MIETVETVEVMRRGTFHDALGCDGNTYFECFINEIRSPDGFTTSDLNISFGGRHNGDSYSTTTIIGIDPGQVAKMIDVLTEVRDHLVANAGAHS